MSLISVVEVKIIKLKFFFLIICIIQLFYIFHFRSGFKYEIIKNPFNENSGIPVETHRDKISKEQYELESVGVEEKSVVHRLLEAL